MWSTGVDGDGHGSDGGHGHHQGALVTFGDVDEAGVIGGVEFGFVVADTILKKKKSQ